MRKFHRFTLAAVLLLSACSPQPQTEEPVRVGSVEQDAREVQGQADAVANLLNVPWTGSGGSYAMSLLGCTGKKGETSTSVVYIFAGYFFTVGEDRTVPAVEQIHAYWTSLGWTMKDLERFPSGGARAEATDPGTGFSYDAATTKTSSTITVGASSTCVRATDFARTGPYHLPGERADGSSYSPHPTGT